jgi:8-oxo-dGTP diphosphatase
MSIVYIVNVEVVVVKGDRYLMTVRSEQETYAPGALSFPGGKVENAGFTADILEATARREVREETGVDLEDEIIYLESKSFVAGDVQPVVDIVFLARYRSGTSTPGDPDEVDSLAWMTAGEIYAHPLCAQWTRDSIRIAEQHRQQLGWD